jgi:hypothetical protein
MIKSIAITTSGTFTIPSDFSSFISVECVGTGGNGAPTSGTYAAGGGGGLMLSQPH